MLRASGLYLLGVLAGLATGGCVSRSGPNAVVETRQLVGAFTRLAFSEDGASLAAYEAFGSKLNIYRAEDLSVITSRKMKAGWPNSFAFSPDGRYLAVDSTNRRKVEIWEPASGETTSLPLGKRRVMAYKFSPDGALFSVLCDSGAMLRWNTEDWTQMPDLPAPSWWSEIGTSRYREPVFSDDASTVIVRGKDSLWSWNLHNDSVARLSGPLNKPIRFAVSMDLTRMAGTRHKGLKFALQAWDVPTGELFGLADAEFGLLKFLCFDFDDASSLAFSGDGKLLAATLASSGSPRRVPEVRIWFLDSGELVWTLPSYDPDWFGPPVIFSPDGSLLAVGGGKIRLFRVEDILPGGGQ